MIARHVRWVELVSMLELESRAQVSKNKNANSGITLWVRICHLSYWHSPWCCPGDFSCLISIEWDMPGQAFTIRFRCRSVRLGNSRRHRRLSQRNQSESKKIKFVLGTKLNPSQPHHCRYFPPRHWKGYVQYSGTVSSWFGLVCACFYLCQFGPVVT